jgi:predicted small metal-binding protein
MATRKVSDCRKTPSIMNCSLTIAGEEEEVIKAAAEHAVSAHEEKDTPELRAEIRKSLEDEVSYPPTARQPEAGREIHS